jgi:hypothetical protein
MLICIGSRRWQNWYQHFNLLKKATVEVTVEVQSGDTVSLYLMDNGDKAEFDDPGKHLLGGFHYYKALTKEGVMKYTSSAELDPGEWNIIVDSDAPLLSGDQTTFHVKITVKP